MLVLLLLCMDSLSNDIQTRGLYAFISKFLIFFNWTNHCWGNLNSTNIKVSVTEPVCLNASLCLLSFNELVHPLMLSVCFVAMLSVCFDAITFFFLVLYSQYLQNGMVVFWTAGMTKKSLIISLFSDTRKITGLLNGHLTNEFLTCVP